MKRLLITAFAFCWKQNCSKCNALQVVHVPWSCWWSKLYSQRPGNRKW